MDQVKKDPVVFVFTLLQFLKEDSDPFLVLLSSNGVSDLFVFRLLLFGSSPVQCLMADIMASKTGIFLSFAQKCFVHICNIYFELFSLFM